jgi:hypothetical protein
MCRKREAKRLCRNDYSEMKIYIKLSTSQGKEKEGKDEEKAKKYLQLKS